MKGSKNSKLLQLNNIVHSFIGTSVDIGRFQIASNVCFVGAADVTYFKSAQKSYGALRP